MTIQDGEGSTESGHRQQVPMQASLVTAGLLLQARTFT
jgi:hypothetical protein